MGTLQAALSLAKSMEADTMPILQDMSILDLDNCSDMQVKKQLHATAKDFQKLKAFASDLTEVYKSHYKASKS